MSTYDRGLARQFLGTLEAAEAIPAAELARYQNALMARVTIHAREHVPAYRHRLDAVFEPGGRFQAESWPKVPILRRDEFRNNSASFLAPDLPAAQGEISWHATTGSTGAPMRVAKTAIAQSVSAAINERQRIWYGLDPAKTLAMLHYSSAPEAAGPDGQTFPVWSLTGTRGAFHLFSTVHAIAEQFKWLQRCRPAYLTAYPSVAAEIATAYGEEARALGIEVVLPYGEMLRPDHRVAIAEGFGARVLDTYSANEVGFIAIECPAGGGYHVMAEAIHVEVLMPDGTPAPSGTPGEVVVTPFYNPVMPLIRYAIGDFAVVAEGPCPCGRPHPRLASVVGRSRTIFRFVDGSAKWPNLHVGRLQAFVPLRQFQVIQHTLRDIEIRYVTRDPSRSVDLTGLNALAQAELHPSVTVTATAVDEIPRGAGGKFEQYLSHIA